MLIQSGGVCPPDQSFKLVNSLEDMTKTIEKSVENYVASVPLAMWKTKRDLMQRRNFKKDYAIEQAFNYGTNMLNAGVGTTITPKQAARIFKELASINLVMADWCESN